MIFASWKWGGLRFLAAFLALSNPLRRPIYPISFHSTSHHQIDLALPHLSSIEKRKKRIQRINIDFNQSMKFFFISFPLLFMPELTEWLTNLIKVLNYGSWCLFGNISTISSSSFFYSFLLSNHFDSVHACVLSLWAVLSVIHQRWNIMISISGSAGAPFQFTHFVGPVVTWKFGNVTRASGGILCVWDSLRLCVVVFGWLRFNNDHVNRSRSQQTK